MKSTNRSYDTPIYSLTSFSSFPGYRLSFQPTAIALTQSGITQVMLIINDWQSLEHMHRWACFCILVSIYCSFLFPKSSGSSSLSWYTVLDKESLLVRCVIREVTTHKNSSCWRVASELGAIIWLLVSAFQPPSTRPIKRIKGKTNKSKDMQIG